MDGLNIVHSGVVSALTASLPLVIGLGRQGRGHDQVFIIYRNIVHSGVVSALTASLPLVIGLGRQGRGHDQVFIIYRKKEEIVKNIYTRLTHDNVIT